MTGQLGMDRNPTHMSVQYESFTHLKNHYMVKVVANLLKITRDNKYNASFELNLRIDGVDNAMVEMNECKKWRAQYKFEFN